MSLDIVLMGDNGHPEQEVCLGVKLHARLIKVASNMKLPLLQRLSDYYEDVEYSAKDVPALLHEVEQMLAVTVDGELRELLEQLDRVGAAACERSRGLEALAD